VGLDGLREVLSTLDGFELAGAAWERAVLPGRVVDYNRSMLDMLCLAGEIGWARLSPRTMELAEPSRLAPGTRIALFHREHSDYWQSLRTPDDTAERRLTPTAARVLEVLRSRGASFFNDVRTAAGLDAEDARLALGTLVANGLAASDGFSGLRALLTNRPSRDRRANFAGRWTAIVPPPSAVLREHAVEAQAWALLRRYGVLFRRLLVRESIAAPWRDLVRVFRRLEARGEIRGGWFVAGMSGEQFALPRAVERLREVRRTSTDGRPITISTADPLNLAGILSAGERPRPSARHRVVYESGVLRGQAVKSVNGFSLFTT
jgi:ATP-dependent helicase Lhr and Lhr-like helicase